MEHKSQARPISWFQEEYRNARLELKPPFQRKPVWGDKQRATLIESILLNVPVPEVYVQVVQREDGSAYYGVVDGQQRLRTILQFIGLERGEDQQGGEDKNNFTLDTLPAHSPHSGVGFADLPADAKKRFYQFEICVRFLYTEDMKQIEDVFKRLNKFAMPLRPQELRNATYHGAFARLSEDLANEEYWAVNRIVTPATIRRMGDIEMMSDLIIGILHGPQGGSARIIDQYYDQYEVFEDEFPEQSRVKRIFMKVRALIERLFPTIVETRWGNRADFYSLFVALGHVSTSHDLPKSKERYLRDKLLRFAQDVDRRLENPTAPTSTPAKSYARAIEKGSNDKARRADRHQALVGVIEPIFVQKR